jgi:hypothetical protein
MPQHQLAKTDNLHGAGEGAARESAILGVKKQNFWPLPPFAIAMAFNMSPEMIRMAQEQMRNMTPEQLASMQRMAANMDPSLLAQQGINPDMARQASEQMSRMSPEEIARQMEKVRAAQRRGDLCTLTMA